MPTSGVSKKLDQLTDMLSFILSCFHSLSEMPLNFFLDGPELLPLAYIFSRKVMFSVMFVCQFTRGGGYINLHGLLVCDETTK